MRKSIILLLGLVLLFAIPTLASTPENENAPAPTSEDQQFIGLTQLSEEELMQVNGEGFTNPFSDNTHDLIIDNEDMGLDLLDFWADYNSYTNTWTVHYEGYTYTMTNSEFRTFCYGQGAF